MSKVKPFIMIISTFRPVLLILFLLFFWGYSSVNAAVVSPAKESSGVLLERQTTEGSVIGAADRNTNTISWRGIPYAQPPVGERRWRSPEPPARRTAPLSAVEFADICPQYVDHDRNPATPHIIMGKEDCLYLNITAPQESAANLPVFFWIHGGGNSIQWPLLSDMDTGILANRGRMVVVTLNYRLGPLGFFHHPALHGDKPGDELGNSGNYALLDIVQALKWVQANIKAFGGDPGNITIVGESAGGQNVLNLLVSPLAANLFHRAISQSGVIRPSAPLLGTGHVNEIVKRLLIKEGKAADGKAAEARLAAMSLREMESYLRSRTPQELLAVYPEGPTRGMIAFPTAFGDGRVLPTDFYRALSEGRYHKVPVILGTNKDEAKLFLMGSPPFLAWRTDGSLFTDPTRLELYELAAKYQSDGWKVMAVDQVARALRNHPDQPPVFAYQFLWGAGGIKSAVLSPPFNILLGAAHAMEIDFVFGTQRASLGRFVFNERNRPGRVALSQAMMDYWSQFAASGDPNRPGLGLPLWEAWSNREDGPKCLLLDGDLEKYLITMSNRELRQEDVEAALQREPRLMEIKPFWDGSPYRRR